MARHTLTAEQAARYWQKTVGLTLTVLILWLGLGYGLHWTATWLNQVRFFNIPAGFFLAAQVSVPGFVVLIFWYSRRQNRIDEDAGVAED